jgi:TRAP-type transport system periplasmic protein
MRIRVLSCVTLAAALSAALPVARAQSVTIKLGTMIPDGSAWHALLKQTAQEWSKASDGKVKLKIFPNGVAGDESDMVRKMRIGQLQAAALTVIGLHDIDTSPQAVATPGLMADDDEFNDVFEKMQPYWEKRFAEKGFVTLMWCDTGNVNMFFAKEVKTAADLHGIRVYSWAGDPYANKAWELAGFQPVVLAATDMFSTLSTGMIQGFAATPVMAFGARWYENAKFMLASDYGHLPGATIVARETWEKIPADLRPKLLDIAKQMGVRVKAEVSRMQADSLAQMKKNGLKVVTFSEADTRAWIAMQEKTWPAMRGGVVTEADFDEAKRLRDAYRSAKVGK